MALEGPTFFLSFLPSFMHGCIYAFLPSFPHLTNLAWPPMYQVVPSGPRNQVHSLPKRSSHEELPFCKQKTQAGLKKTQHSREALEILLRSLLTAYRCVYTEMLPHHHLGFSLPLQHSMAPRGSRERAGGQAKK